MTEATGVEAKTIHRLLEVDPRSGGFKRNPDNSLDCDLLVVDEASMVDVMLMQALVKAIPDKAALLIVGDIDHRNVSGRRRWSKLDEWLRLGAPFRSSNSSKADEAW